MDFDEYQRKTGDTDLGTAWGDNLTPGWLYYVLGLAGETGELMEKVKKLFRDNNGIVTDKFIDDLTKELGDIQWYHARLANWFNIKSSKIAKTNLEKLSSRMKRNEIHGDGDNR